GGGVVPPPRPPARHTQRGSVLHRATAVLAFLTLTHGLSVLALSRVSRQELLPEAPSAVKSLRSCLKTPACQFCAPRAEIVKRTVAGKSGDRDAPLRVDAMTDDTSLRVYKQLLNQ